jgi:hypothetical protein
MGNINGKGCAVGEVMRMENKKKTVKILKRSLPVRNCRDCKDRIRFSMEKLNKQWGLCDSCFASYKKIGEGLSIFQS